jgi:L-fuconolactonase
MFAHEHAARRRAPALLAPLAGRLRLAAPDAPGLAPLYRDFLPPELDPLLRHHGVRRTVLVQAAPTEAETEYLLALADEAPRVAGVVGWVDLAEARSALTLERWARHPLFRGVRPMLQDLPDPDWLDHAPHPAVLERLLALELRFDALVKPPQLPALLRFVERHPELPVIVDHAAKPPLAQRWDSAALAAWRRGLADVARHPQVSCKLSGLLTEATPAQCRNHRMRVDLLRPVWDHLLENFGPQRLMWGSDWPVLTLAAGYDTWMETSTALIYELSREEGAMVWQDNAVRVYGLADPEQVA